MLEDLIEEFTTDLFLFLTGVKRPGRSLLIKKHTDNLQTHGDISFPNSQKSWHGIVNNEDDSKTFLDVRNLKSSDLIEESKKWKLQVGKVAEENDRVHIFLDRQRTIYSGLSSALRNIHFLSSKLTEKSLNVSTNSCDMNFLTSLRVKYLKMAVENLCTVLEQPLDVIVSAKSSSKSVESKSMLCGPVLNTKTLVKETTVTAEELIRKRQEEMMLIAQHKYGVRVAHDTKWKEFIDHLGESAVVFELLQTRPSSAVKVNMDCSAAGSSKGASFILYNCARLETIIRTFKEKVSEGIYPDLTEFDKTDFTLLTQEDEWYLIYNFILGLPSLLRSCVDTEGAKCEFKPHQICSFLCSMVRIFSQYYRKIRILTEPRTHLLPVMFARIHMLIILNDTLKICLKILNIKSVSQMCFSCFN